jgi:tetratricopeptide (TPR) repeat protein
MFKSRAFLVSSIFLLCPLSARAQLPSDSNQLFSPSVAQKFYEIAYELANSEDISKPQAEQAIAFLTATMNLDRRAKYVYPLMIEIASRYSDRDYSEMVRNLLTGYVDKSADLEVVRKAVQYLLDRLDSREQREQLLKEMLQTLSGKNPVLDSELATLLGLLTAEKADFQTAQTYLMQAFDSNRYNKLAFTKLSELAGEQLEPAMYLEHLRFAFAENPINLHAALGFAQYAEQLQLYQTAADTYEYCADLFSYLYPSQDLPPHIYLPWTISNYNTQRNQNRCLQIAAQFRQSGRFDLLLEAIAGKAAAKIGDNELAKRIFQEAEDKALELSIDTSRLTNDISQTTNYKQLAWFYCFAATDADKAIDWANKAYSIEPNSPTAAALLAYSLVMNDQIDWAMPLIENYQNNQIADLTLAKIQLAQGQKDSAIETLKSAIKKDPAALEAELAKEILATLGGEYLPPIDPDITLTVLRNTFGQVVVPKFTPPEEIISVQLSVRGSKFSYGSSFDTIVVITNNSSSPLVISDDGLFKGNIRVDADITGDLNKEIPNLVSIKTSPALPIEPGQSISVPLRLVTAELRHLLLTYPQASLDIEFTVYLDPVITDQGPANAITGIKPAKALINRPGIELAGKFLRNRFNSLSEGRQGQKIKTAQLFTGLLAEQNAMADRQPFYKFTYADWMPDLLKSALLHNLTDDDWVVRVNTMADMLSLPLDYDVINTLAENLNDSYWPVRMMAVFLLAKNQNTGFNKVLDWTAEYDSNSIVRDMAVALGAALPPPPPVQEPTKQPQQQPPEPNK